MNVEGGAKPEYLIVTFGTRNSGDTIVLGTKYLGCKTIDDINAVEPNYKTIDIIDGVWNESLADLEDSNPSNRWNGGMFIKCTNLTTFNSDLSSLTNGNSMFGDCTNLTTFNADLSSLTDSTDMFCYCSKLESITSDLSSLTNSFNMFADCTSLTTFNVVLSSLIYGESMFWGCTNLESFTSDLSSLTNGSWMFYQCYGLTAFDSNLSSLTDGDNMFDTCTNLTTFNSDLSSLTEGGAMFFGCSNLESFTSDLSNLTDGDNMFEGCSKLKSFTSDLSSLTYGSYMFYGCSLDSASVKNIAETINDVRNIETDYWNTNKIFYIGIGNTSPNTEEIEAFNAIVSKGWQLFVNGSSDAYVPAIASLDETDETTLTPIPYWAKPVQSDEKHARYIDNEGNYYNILGAQFIYGDDLSTYGMFTCEEDAAAQMRLTKVEKRQFFNFIKQTNR